MENAQVTLNMMSALPIIEVAGEIDLATVPQLQHRLDEISIDTARVIVDLTNVTFIDSSGLGALVACQKRLNGGADRQVLHLVISKSTILNVFEITGLREVFPITATVDEAIAIA